MKQQTKFAETFLIKQKRLCLILSNLERKVKQSGKTESIGALDNAQKMKFSIEDFFSKCEM